VQLSADQEAARVAVLGALRAGAREVVLSGPAGSGKTTLTRQLIQDVGRELRAQVKLMAPTGKAALRLSELSGRKARTIHSVLYQRCDEDKEGDLHFADPKAIADNGTIVICDEASMVGQDLHRDVLATLPPRSTVIWVGDREQLPPVNDTWGPDFDNPTACLTQVHRQAADSQIIQVATAIRQGLDWRAVGVSPLPEGASGSYRHASGNVGKAAAWLADRRAKGMDATILTYANRVRVACNRAVREARGLSGLVQPGDVLVCTKNAYHADICNGEVRQVARVVGENVYWTGGTSGVWVKPETFGAGGDRAAWDVATLDMDPGERDAIVRMEFGECLTIHKCVHPSTLTETTQGLLPISMIAPAGTIGSPGGPREYKGLVSNPAAAMLRIETQDGYVLRVTPDHGVDVWNGLEYVRMEAQEIPEGAFLRLRLGVTVEPTDRVVLPGLPAGNVRSETYRTPAEMSDDLAEFLGLMVADGSVYDRGFRLAKRHKDVADRFDYLCRALFGAHPKRFLTLGAYHVEVNSTRLVSWLRLVGGMAPNDKRVPECVLRSGSSTHAAFLRGLFEDGSVHTRKAGEMLDHVEWSSVFPELLQVVQTMLLRLGIICGTVRPTFEVPCKRLTIYGQHAKRFADRVGMIAAFKLRRLALPTGQETRYRIPLSKAEANRFYLSKLLTVYEKQNARATGYVSRLVGEALPFGDDRAGYHHSKVWKITGEVAPSMCVTVPEGHRFLQNGFAAWNSQGSQWDAVCVLHDSTMDWQARKDPDSYRRLLYTAVTRAAKELIIVEV
jgi:tRNA A37 threonylcarbamoyladenosine biosynthesis protein TsaE